MTDLIKTVNGALLSPDQVKQILLDKYAIGSEVELIDGKIAIKVEHRFSLATIIEKISRDFSFTVFHKRGSIMGYIIYLENEENWPDPEPDKILEQL